MQTLSPRSAPVVPEIAIDPRSIQWFRRESFPAAGPVPWLDRPDALARIEAERAAGNITAIEAGLARSWARDGYVILPRFFSEDRLETTWRDFADAAKSGVVELQPNPYIEGDPFPNRFNNAHWHVPAMNALLHDGDVVRIVELLLGVEPMPFQTIVFHTGSEQKVHSDTVHMTTYPLGYMLATWIAFEDSDPNAGPLEYYPGSHRLPYLTMGDVGVPPESFAESGYADYAKSYEPAVTRMIEEHGLKPAHFAARTGDLFFWHANLLHAGSTRRDTSLSRRSVVCHYFAEGCLTYHDIAAVPSHVLLAQMEPDPNLMSHIETTRSWSAKKPLEI